MSDQKAVEDLVVNAMGYGVMMASEGRDALIGRLRHAGPDSTLADVLRSDAQAFMVTRCDLVEALDT